MMQVDLVNVALLVEKWIGPRNRAAPEPTHRPALASKAPKASKSSIKLR